MSTGKMAFYVTSIDDASAAAFDTFGATQPALSGRLLCATLSVSL